VVRPATTDVQDTVLRVVRSLRFPPMRGVHRDLR
jgi:hypothetical protein